MVDCACGIPHLGALQCAHIFEPTEQNSHQRCAAVGGLERRSPKCRPPFLGLRGRRDLVRGSSRDGSRGWKIVTRQLLARCPCVLTFPGRFVIQYAGGPNSALGAQETGRRAAAPAVRGPVANITSVFTTPSLVFTTCTRLTTPQIVLPRGKTGGFFTSVV